MSGKRASAFTFSFQLHLPTNIPNTVHGKDCQSASHNLKRTKEILLHPQKAKFAKSFLLDTAFLTARLHRKICNSKGIESHGGFSASTHATPGSGRK